MTDLDPLLREAMKRLEGPVDLHPSISDVHRRARRHSRRRMTATAGALACTGVATAALIIHRDATTSTTATSSDSSEFVEATDNPTTSFTGGGVSATTTTLFPPAPITIDARLVWNALINAHYDPAGAGLNIQPADAATINVMPTPEQFGCTANECRTFFSYVVWHEIAKMMGLIDLQSLQNVNPSIDFSQPPREGDVLQGSPAVSDFPVESTSTSIALPTCDQRSSAPIAVVINASHIDGIATTWTGVLASNVPTVTFADPVNALAPEAQSRILALDGYQCEASQMSFFTTATGVETATIETMQSLVGDLLPAGTAIMVVVGDDQTAQAATTTTIVGPVSP